MPETTSGTSRRRLSADYSDEDLRSDHNDKPRSRRNSIGHELVDRLEDAIGLNPSGSCSLVGRRSRCSHRREYRFPHSRYGRRGPGRRVPYSPSPTRFGGRSRDDASKERRKREHAVEAAIDAGAVEAFRLRNESGSWTGRKGARVATAALGAAAIDTLLVNEPSRHGTVKVAESTIGGLVVNRVLNGPRRS
ncbi:hypothetical protein F5883DRAFT_126703 [Diaporthe sp. PMI_573]|nr:hypothetical protein F5883DRAFT_126703 [Diaporthaceae sp. PMI_573]